MTREEIIAMAREAGFVIGGEMCPDKIFNPHTSDEFSVHVELERFAALVAAHEREECAKVVEANAKACDTYSTARAILESNVAAIRARGRGCTHCNNPLFVGRKCKNCGREFGGIEP